LSPTPSIRGSAAILRLCEKVYEFNRREPGAAEP
jgi:hypothetical protein